MPKFVKEERLTNDNYEVWQILAREYLVRADMWEYVSGEMTKRNARDEKAWEVMDRKVMATIIELIDPGQTQLIMTCTSSRQMWERLREVNESTGPTRLIKLCVKFITDNLKKTTI